MSEDKPLSRGWRRAQELKQAAGRELEQLKAALIDCLGREATAVDVIAIEALASATVSARRQRARGKNDREDLRLVAQLLRATGLRPAPAGPAATPSLEDTLAEIAAEAAEETDIEADS
jgi:hypothetical protein